MTPSQQHRVILIGGPRNGEIMIFDGRPPITISLVVHQSGSDISDVLAESWEWVHYRRINVSTYGSLMHTYVSHDIYEEYMLIIGVLTQDPGNDELISPASMQGGAEYPWDAIQRETAIINRIDEVIDNG